MKNAIFLCLSFIFICTSNQIYGQARIVEDGNVQTAVNKYISLNKQSSSIAGWRIQIVTTNDRRKMESAIAKLNQKYPNLDYDWKHASPYYQLKVGSFEEKEDLQNMLITLKRDFPSSIPVKDEVEKADLVK